MAKIKACIAEIRAWMLTHRLKLNDDKTEFVVFAPPRITKVKIDGVRIGDCDIEPNPCARNIEVYFDSGTLILFISLFIYLLRFAEYTVYSTLVNDNKNTSHDNTVGWDIASAM